MLQNIYILSPLNRATNVLGLDVLGMLLTDTVVFERIYYYMLETDLKKNTVFKRKFVRNALIHVRLLRAPKISFVYAL